MKNARGNSVISDGLNLTINYSLVDKGSESSEITKLIYDLKNKQYVFSIIPEKINYRLGEPVHVRIINSGTVPLTFSDSSYGLKIVGLDGTAIFLPISAQVISTLNPKEEKTFVWDQTKTDGSKIFQGRYKIISSTWADSSNVLKKSVTINIFKTNQLT